MRAPDEIKAALAAIGFEAKDISPNDDPAYTRFRRGNELFEICYGVEGKALNIYDAINSMKGLLDD